MTCALGIRRNGFSGGGGVEWYQFAAISALPRRLSFLDLGFWWAFGREDLFFFFWSSRPILGRCSWLKLRVWVDLGFCRISGSVGAKSWFPLGLR